MMKKLAIIGANEFQQRLIIKAKEMGLETHVFAWREGAVGAADADFFYTISITERDEILEICRRVGIDGITSIGSDLAVVTVNYVAEELGLPGNSVASIDCCTNKYSMRRRLMEAGVSVPKFQKVARAEDVDLTGYGFPIIVKPTDRSGSRSITKLESPEGLEEAVKSAAEVSFEKRAIVEEYLEGEEFSCECISYQGRHTMLAITKKFTTGAPNYIETGHMEPAALSPEDYENVRGTVFQALTALGVVNGASHSEFKYHNGQAKLIEIGARMGGDYIGSDLVYLSTGMDFVAMTIDVALGNAPDLTPKKRPQKAFVRFIMNEDDIDAWERFRQTHEIYRHSQIVRGGHEAVIDSSSRWGYYIYLED